MERALLDARTGEPRHHERPDARETLARSREIDGIRTRLVAAGLVHRPWGSGVTRAKFFLLLAVPVLAAGLTVAGPSPSCSRPTSTSG